MDGSGGAGPHGRSFTLAVNETEKPAKHVALHSRAAMFAQPLGGNVYTSSEGLYAPTCRIILVDVAVFWKSGVHAVQNAEHTSGLAVDRLDFFNG